MKLLVPCVIVVLFVVPSGFSKPQGLGGLLPTAAPQGEGGSPPKGPLAIFTQGQQSAQNAVNGFISGLVETGDKIRNETKKRIQSLLNGNKKEDTSDKSEESVTPDKGDKEVLPEKIEEAPSGDKEKESLDEKDHKPEHDKHPGGFLQEKVKHSEPDKKESPQKHETPTDSTSSTSMMEDEDIEKLIDAVFATSDPPQLNEKKEESKSKEEAGKE